MVHSKAALLSMALEARFPPAERRALVEPIVARARSHKLTVAELEAGRASWRQLATDLGMTVEELATGLAPLFAAAADVAGAAGGSGEI